MILRPKVSTAVGEPIDVRALLDGPETPDEIRRVTDIVWSRLIDLVEQLRGLESPTESGIEPVELVSDTARAVRHRSMKSCEDRCQTPFGYQTTRWLSVFGCS